MVSFRKNDFPNAAGLAKFLQTERARARMQPDHKLVFRGDFDTAAERIKGVRQLVSSLARIAGEAKAAA